MDLKRKYPEKFNDFQSFKTIIMYHGTSRKACMDILKNGFVVSSSGTLGSGVYVSKNIEKAKKYVRHKNNERGVILKVEVDTGLVKKIYKIDHYCRKNWKTYGYDSAWTPSGSGVSIGNFEEFCISDPQKVKVKAVLDANGTEIGIDSTGSNMC